MNSSIRLPRQLVRAPLTMRAELQHFALVTHSVPAERVRARLPRELELDTFRGVDGDERAMISTGCFRNVGFRPTLIPFGGLDFEQLTFRTYVRYRGRSALYFFGTILSKTVPYLLQHLAAREAQLGKFHVHREFEPKRGYSAYTTMVRSSLGETFFKLRALDTPKIDATTQSLTYRLHGLFASTVSSRLADQMVAHRRISPWGGELIEGRFDFWERLGILRQDESNNPYAVHVEPSVVFQFYPPVPAWLVAPSLERLREHGLHSPRG